jgi:DNA-directed RNA polymerase subunit RPC12/RpoP
MDLNFQCPNCQQDLTVDASGAGSEIECPSCNSRIVIPQPVKGEAHVINAMASSAAAKEEKHFTVPQRDIPTENLIGKPLVPLDVAAKTTDKQLRVKTIRRSDCVEVGKDHFDEIVSQFLGRVGEAAIVTITPITYSHMDLASREWIADFGVVIVYRG